MLWAKTAACIKGVYVQTMLHCQQDAVFLRSSIHEFEVNVAQHFIHMVCQECRAYNHEFINFETMLPPFNDPPFRSKFAHDKALFDSPAVLISKRCWAKVTKENAQERPHFFKESNPNCLCSVVQKAGAVNKSDQIIRCRGHYVRRKTNVGKPTSSGWIAMWRQITPSTSVIQNAKHRLNLTCTIAEKENGLVCSTDLHMRNTSI